MSGIPLEYLMFGGIGFCLAWLTALMVLPAVHNRAARLARAALRRPAAVDAGNPG